MTSRYGSRDFEEPHKFFTSIQLIPVAVTNIMQRGFWRQTQGGPYTIAYQSVQPGALVHFIGMRKSPALVEYPPVIATKDWGTIHVIKETLSKVRRWREILQTLLVLDSNDIASKIVSDSHGSDVHLALRNDLGFGQIRRLALSKIELHSSAL